MWSFFGLLFFGGITLYKIIDDQIHDDIHRRSINKKISITKSLSINLSKECDLIKSFRNNRTLFVKELGQINDDMIYIFGKEWQNLICNSEFNTTYNSGDPIAVAYNVYLAKKGYLSSFFRGYYNTGGVDNYSQNLKGLQVIEKYMREAHPDLNLELIVCPRYSFDLDKKMIFNEELYLCEIKWNYDVNTSVKEYKKRMKKLSDIEL